MRIDIGQLEFIDIKLRRLVLWLEKETGLEFTTTSLFRMNDDGVHGTLPLRGMDLRMRSKSIGQDIETYINDHWEYDDQRPEEKYCCFLHGKGSNLHLHIQVHPNTVEIGA